MRAAVALAGVVLLSSVLTLAQQPALGSVSFENSGAPAAQDSFLAGLAQLHNFEYAAAADLFRRAQQIDPAFAMAYWGEAMTYNHPVWMEQDRGAARKALARLAPTREACVGNAKTPRAVAAVERLRRAREALAAFEKSLARAPERTASLAGVMRAAERVGDSKKAAAVRARLQTIWK